jgi:DNA-binding NtrC family response regulator
LNKILIVDDDDKVRVIIRENLKDHGFLPIEASSGKEAILSFKTEKPSLALLDFQMPGMDGIETMKELKKFDPDVPIIFLTAHGDISTAVEAMKLGAYDFIVTAHGDISTAVEAMKLGAYDFIVKPPNFDLLVLTLKRASEKVDLSNKVKTLNNEVKTSLELLLGHSGPMKKVIQQIHQISQSDISLIIQGETGTGKSFIARTIHNLSKRANARLVTVDIGSVPETLVESELFGYEKGAFTGADQKKKGFFEIANGGTILIDELQNLSPYVQSKLLMAVEEKNIYPLGSTDPVKTDVRIIGATNTDIRKSVTEQKKFREDLFYRLSEYMIFLPPLRERPEDIPFLAEKFIRETAEDFNKQVNSISDQALELLKNYSWPGNIRELKNVIRRAVLFSDKEIIKPGQIEFFKDEDAALIQKPEKPSNVSLAEMEKETIKQTLHTSKGNKTKAASILKISYTTLLRKIKQHSL